jgi:hypothetical protein
VRTASADISEKIVGGIDRSRVAIRLLGVADIARLYDGSGPTACRDRG